MTLNAQFHGGSECFILGHEPLNLKGAINFKFTLINNVGFRLSELAQNFSRAM